MRADGTWLTLAEFTLKFEKLPDPQIYDEWPELYSVNVDGVSTIAMYRRAAAEARAVLSKYPVGVQVLT
jgi:hypothetical protein